MKNNFITAISSRLVSACLLSICVLLGSAYRAGAVPIAGGTYTYGAGGTYATLALAIADLNTNGVAGAVTLNVQAGYTAETAPAGGYLLGTTLLNSTTSATNTITINGAATFTITATTGTGTYDGIFRLAGIDYTTLNGLILQESAANVTAVTQMEDGIMVVNLNGVAPLDGCQFDQILNCSIRLNRTNTNSCNGIASFHQTATAATALTPTATTDLHSNNKYYGNTITNVTEGIWLLGYSALTPFTLFDQNNDVGGSSLATGNSITNFGGSGAFYGFGVYCVNQNNANASYNTINNTAGGGVSNPTGLVGIYLFGTNSTFTATNNNITLVQASAAAYTIANYGIYGNAAGTNYTITNNTVNTTQNAGAAVNAFATYFPNGGNVTVSSNNLTTNQAASNGYSVYTTATGTISVTNNTVQVTTLATITGQIGFFMLIGASASETVTGNTINNGAITLTTSGSIFCNYIGANVTNGTYSNNTFNVKNSNTGTIFGFINNGGTLATGNINNNIINYTQTANGPAYGVYFVTAATNCNVNSNAINLQLSGTGAAAGIYNTTTVTTGNFNNNNITVRNAGNTSIYGIYNTAGTNTTISADTVDLSTTGTTVSDYWIYNLGLLSTLTVQNCVFKSSFGLSTTTGINYLISNATSTPTVNITGNSTSGTITKSGAGGSFYGYYNVSSAPASGVETISNNNFSNISTTGATTFMGIASSTTTNQQKIINSNTINNITCGTNACAGVVANALTTTSTVNSNVVSNINCDGNFYAINIASALTLGALGTSLGGTVSGNRVSNINSTAASATIEGILGYHTAGALTMSLDTIAGLHATGNTSPLVNGIHMQALGTNNVISQCNISDLSTLSATGSPLINGIYCNGSVTPSLFKNNVNNLNAGSASGAATQVVGLNLQGASAYNAYNNFISDLRSAGSTNTNGIVGINCATSGGSWGLYYNTIYLGSAAVATSSGANFGAQGVLYPTGANLLTLKNNIINVNVTPTGTGFAAAVCRNTAGTGCTAPTTTNFNANNNIYNISAGINNYLYVDATTSSNARNGFAMSGLVASVPNNIVNDAAFNTTCSIYKMFMSTGSRETATASEDNLAAGSSTGTFAPSGSSYAESTGTGIAVPSITDDYAGISRGATPDIGALQFSGTFINKVPYITPAAPPVVCAPSAAVLTANPNGTNMTYQWSNTSGNIAGATNSTYAATASGTYSVTITVTNPCGGTCVMTTPVGVVVTVNPAPLPNTGTPTVCEGATTTLSNATPGGVWSSSASGTASVSATGVVSGVLAGTANISYTTSGCTPSVTTVTVNAMPGAIGGPTSICQGSTATLTNSISGGTWTSTFAGAPIGASNGVVNGTSGGTSNITYTLTGGCYTTTVFTVYPAPGPISGPSVVCVGQTITMSNSVTGGTWSSTANASVGASSGVVTGVTAGNATITYTATGCTAVTKAITVNALAPITGITNICYGYTSSLADAVTGGAWVSSTPSVATINSSGVVTSVSVGTSTISYILPTGCTATVIVTINALGPITGSTLQVCQGSTITLADIAGGGTWSFTPTSVATAATIGFNNGTVTGVGPGVGTVTYTMPSGCYATATILVNALPSAISGPSAVCVNSSITVTDPSPGGSWSTASPEITLSTSGVVTGVSSGTAIVSYTLPTGCYVTKSITVNPLPAAISPAIPYVCIGLTNTLTDPTTGGTWSSSNTAVGTIGASNGVAGGISAGVSNITYKLTATGCYITTVLFVTTPPSTITGTSKVCEEHTVTLSDSVAGGTWSSSATSVATVNPASGIVTGISVGIVTISYTTTACVPKTYQVTVNALPAPITGFGSVCVGSTTTLYDVTPLGTWSISGPFATISSSGVVTGLSYGTTSMVSYTVPSGCFRSVPMMVDSLPGPIVGIDSVCPGASVTLTNVSPDGLWSSSNGTIATAIAATGEVIGVVPGTVNISYTLISGCYRSIPFKVITPLPAGVSISTSPTPSPLCEGTTVTFTATPVNGGTPFFEWRKFGVTIDTGATITYAPSHGDYIMVIMTPQNICAAPIAKDSILLDVYPVATPIITIRSDFDPLLITPTNPCQRVTGISYSTSVTGDTATILWSPAAGSTGYEWLVSSSPDIPSSGTPTTLTGATAIDLNSMPPYYILVRNKCASGYSDWSSNALLADYWGQVVTFFSEVTYGGTSPAYQWYKDGVAIPGATHSSYSTPMYYNGNYTCGVISNAPCATATASVSNFIRVMASPLSVSNVSSGASNFTLFPNPNSGAFTLKGDLTSSAKSIDIEICDMLGNIVQRQTINVHNSSVNEQITLDNSLANGSYMLRLTSDNERATYLFTLNK